VQAADGYFRILGRIDDVINVARHRLGTKEIESAAITVQEIAEAAAVPVIDDVRGRAVEMYVSLKPGVKASNEEIADKVSKAIDTEIGKIASVAQVVQELVRRAGRVGAHNDPSVLDDIVGDLLERGVDDGDVVGGGVRASVPRPQEAGERLARAVQERAAGETRSRP
jgi:acyl-CoA synthetase (AMP-forming)/AMP-acid ligase II